MDISSIPSVMQIGGFTVFMLGLIAAICGRYGHLRGVYDHLCGHGLERRSEGPLVRPGGRRPGGRRADPVVLHPSRHRPVGQQLYHHALPVVLDHSLDPQDKGFQQSRSILAIGSGQLFGQGLLHGIQTQADYSSALPARDTDFIFAVCGEELGRVGCLPC